MDQPNLHDAYLLRLDQAGWEARGGQDEIRMRFQDEIISLQRSARALLEALPCPTLPYPGCLVERFHPEEYL